MELDPSSPMAHNAHPADTEKVSLDHMEPVKMEEDKETGIEGRLEDEEDEEEEDRGPSGQLTSSRMGNVSATESSQMFISLLVEGSSIRYESSMQVDSGYNTTSAGTASLIDGLSSDCHSKSFSSNMADKAFQATRHTKVKMSDPSNMEIASSSPADSTNLVSVEAADAELMKCDDLLNENEITCHEETCSLSRCSLSQHSRMTDTSSWHSLTQDRRETCASPSSLSQDGRVTSCSSVSEDGRFLNGEYLEKEKDEFDENGSTSKLGTGSEESVRPTSCASSSSTDPSTTEAAKMLVSVVTAEAVKTLVATEPLATESVKIPENAPLQTDLRVSIQVVDVGAKETAPSLGSGFQEEDSKNKTLAGGYGEKKKKSHWRGWFSRKQMNNVHSAPLQPSKNTGESKEDAHCSEQTPLFTSTGACQSDTEHISDQVADDKNTETKSSRLSNFFRNMFSKFANKAVL
ncbi:hypothetical protein L3Q82_001790 [Scortum barcoo]|uniref:Uncharacterized protein n=1 Tax=Scortum barcoo TaxID=214431 RepID=A0ACB8W4T5_9TELE|nr:hypothetical protein L3Q82_001790 [Scortum barcoo]